MNEEPIEYCKYKDKNIVLIGTAHISSESIKFVKKMIDEKNPDAIAIELCKPRFDILFNEEQWENTDILKILKEKKLFFLLVNIFLSNFQKKVGDKIGAKPGGEMIAAYEKAKEKNISLKLIDRKSQTTLLRIWNKITLWTRIKLFFNFLFSIFESKSLTKEKVESLKRKDQTQHLLQSMEKFIPDVKKYLIDERDLYMAQKIRELKEKNIIAIVGAGHLRGVKEAIQSTKEKVCKIKSLDSGPEKSFSLLGFTLKWSVPFLIIAMLIYGFNESLEKGLSNLAWWIFLNGSFSAIGVLIARGYLTTSIFAFLMAPITSVIPFLGVAYFTAYAEVYKRKPTIKDLKEVKNYINQFNVGLMSALGSTIATYLAISLFAIK